jgi:hypothetical protein
MGAVAVAGYVIATALGGITCPFELVYAVGAATFLAGLGIYRTGG